MDTMRVEVWRAKVKHEEDKDEHNVPYYVNMHYHATAKIRTKFSVVRKTRRLDLRSSHVIDITHSNS